MKKGIIICILVITTLNTFGQNISQEYFDLVKNAYSLYNSKDYKTSAETYTKAFKSNGWKGLSNDRYNAACSWALASVPDSAFFQLNRIATLMNYTNLGHISTDSDLFSLHDDNRWKPLLEKIKQNKDKVEAKWNKPLVARLDSIYTDDQKYRQQLKEIEKNLAGTLKKCKVIGKLSQKKTRSI